jgi:hypothetical protein
MSAKTTTSAKWVVHQQSPTNKNMAFVMPTVSSGAMTPQWLETEGNATIDRPQLFDAAGSIFMPITSNTIQPAELEYYDELDAEIAQMTEEEILRAVAASAGMWADRDDLDLLLDRSDRIDDLYASYPETHHKPTV